MSDDFDPTLFNAGQAQADADRATTWETDGKDPAWLDDVRPCDDCRNPFVPADLVIYTETPPTWVSPREEARLCASCLNERIQRAWPSGKKWGRR
jgi:hypothetical protein